MIEKGIDNSIEYDAFISYSHNELDSLIAETLHRKLEHYHIPRMIKRLTGWRKISRIFRDKEELPLSSNLTDNIYEALDHSRFLILICSPESMRSEWVQREVDYFVKKHGKEQVLTVLLKGEPEDILPPLLCEDVQTVVDQDGNRTLSIAPVEPLAADIRGKNKREILKKLDREILRLLATMMGCTYDSLRQRHREYFIKRVVALCGFALVTILCFAGYSDYQKYQFDQQRRKTLRSQAEYLAEQSEIALKSGNREDALRKAVEISWEDGEPASPLQYYALNSALYSYKSGTWKEYAPERTLDGNCFLDGMFSETGKFYYALNDLGEGFVFSGETGEQLWVIDTEYIEYIKEECIAEGSQYADTDGESKVLLLIPYQEDTFLIVLQYAVCIINADTCEVMKVFPMYGNISAIHSYELQEDFFAIVLTGTLMYEDGCYISAYDLTTGKCECLTRFDACRATEYKEKEEQIFSFIPERLSISVNKKRNRIAWGASWSKYDDSDSGGTKGLSLYDYKDNECQVLSDAQTVNVLFANDNYLVALQREPPVIQKESIDGSSTYTYYPAVYDINTGKQLYEGERITVFDVTSSGLICEQFNYEGKLDEYIIIWLDDRVMVMDLDTGDVCCQLGFDTNVLSVNKMETYSFMVGTETGWFQEVTISDSIYRYDRMKLSSTVQRIDYNKIADCIATIIDGEVIFCRVTSDPDMIKCIVSENQDKVVKSIDYMELNDRIYRCVKLDEDLFGNATEVVLYDIKSEECLYDICSKEGYGISEIELFEDNGRIYMDFIERMEMDALLSDEHTLSLHRIDLSDGKEIFETQIKDITLYGKVVFNQKHSKMISQTDKNVFVVLDICETGIENTAVVDMEVGEADIIWEKIEGSDSLLCIAEGWDDESFNFFTYDISSNSRKNLNIHMAKTARGTIEVATGKSTSKMCVYNGEILYIIDPDRGMKISQIAVSEIPASKIPEAYMTIDFAFFDKDDYLLLTYGNTVFIYDSEAGNLLDSLTFHSSDNVLDAYDTLELITDSSESFFALKDMSFRATPRQNSNMQILFVFYVDGDKGIYPFTEVSHGYVSLVGKEISVRAGNYLKYTSFYDWSQLKGKAEKLLLRGCGIQ